MAHIARPNRIARTLGGTALAVTLALSAGVAHAADSGSGSGSNADKQARLEQLCAKVPALENKVDAAITRLQADASTKGSIAWLQAKLDAATTAGHTQAVTVLQNRIQVRTDTLALLQTKQQKLAKVAQVCADHGLGA